MERSAQWHRTEARMKARRALRKRKYWPNKMSASEIQKSKGSKVWELQYLNKPRRSDVISPLASSGKKYRVAAGAMVPVVVSTKEEIDVDAELRNFDIGLKEENSGENRVIAVDPAVPVGDKSAFLITDEGGVVEVIPAKKGFRMRLRHIGWIVAIALFGGLLWFLATTFWQLLHMK